MTNIKNIRLDTHIASLHVFVRVRCVPMMYVYTTISKMVV